MMRRVLLAGNFLQGDCWLAHWLLPDDGHENVVVCCPRNAEIYEVMRREVLGVRIDHIDVRGPVEDGDCQGELRLYRAWLNRYAPQECADGAITMEAMGIACIPMRPFPALRRPRQPAGDLVTHQLWSAHPGKEWPAILDACAGLNSVTLWQGQGAVLGRAEHVGWAGVWTWLAQSSLHVGINSSVTILAYCMRVPTILCSYIAQPNWAEWDTTHGHFLERPSVETIRAAIAHVRRDLVC